MPRFYFDITQRTVATWDDCGQEFDSLEAAEREALRAAGELARDQLRKGLPADLRVEVKDEQRQLMLSVMISTMVDRAARDTSHVSRLRSNTAGTWKGNWRPSGKPWNTVGLACAGACLGMGLAGIHCTWLGLHGMLPAAHPVLHILHHQTIGVLSAGCLLTIISGVRNRLIRAS